jgi:hypothetical protein
MGAMAMPYSRRQGDTGWASMAWKMETARGQTSLSVAPENNAAIRCDQTSNVAKHGVPQVE